MACCVSPFDCPCLSLPAATLLQRYAPNIPSQLGLARAGVTPLDRLPAHRRARHMKIKKGNHSHSQSHRVDLVTSSPIPANAWLVGGEQGSRETQMRGDHTDLRTEKVPGPPGGFEAATLLISDLICLNLASTKLAGGVSWHHVKLHQCKYCRLGRGSKCISSLLLQCGQRVRFWSPK